MSLSNLPSVDAGTVQAWLDKGEALLIDVREPDEHARERIAGARLLPLSRFEPQRLAGERGKTLVFHCNPLQHRQPHCAGGGVVAGG
jgi:rhodanese-related sulfurtransferase